MNNCEYEKDKHCTLNECMYADLRDKPGYPICSMLTTVEKITVDMHDKYSEKELITYNGTKNGEPYRIELEAENLDLAEHDKQIRADTINEFVTRFEKEYSRIAVNLGEFRKYQYEMHRLAENMVKEQK